MKYDYRILQFTVICWNGSYLIDCSPLVLGFSCCSSLGRSSQDLGHSCFKLITVNRVKVLIQGANSIIILTPLLCSSETPPWWRCAGGSKAWARRRSGPSPKTSCRCPWPWRTSPSRSKRSPNPSPPQTWRSTRRGWQSLARCKERPQRGWSVERNAEILEDNRFQRRWRREHTNVYKDQWRLNNWDLLSPHVFAVAASLITQSIPELPIDLNKQETVKKNAKQQDQGMFKWPNRPPATTFYLWIITR